MLQISTQLSETCQLSQVERTCQDPCIGLASTRDAVDSAKLTMSCSTVERVCEVAAQSQQRLASALKVKVPGISLCQAGWRHNCQGCSIMAILLPDHHTAVIAQKVLVNVVSLQHRQLVQCCLGLNSIRQVQIPTQSKSFSVHVCLVPMSFSWPSCWEGAALAGICILWNRAGLPDARDSKPPCLGGADLPMSMCR